MKYTVAMNMEQLAHHYLSDFEYYTTGNVERLVELFRLVHKSAYRDGMEAEIRARAGTALPDDSQRPEPEPPAPGGGDVSGSD